VKNVLRLMIGVIIIFITLPCEWIYAQPIISGAGATFPSPLYFRWIEEYGKTVPSKIIYRETGSSEGIRLLLAKEVDFGATDAFLPDGRMHQTAGKILHIPTCIGAVAIIYNMEDNTKIRLTPSILSEIFMGRITSWSDYRIRNINPDAKIKPLKITVIHRSEGSGTTFLLSDYFSQVSAVWRKKIGTGQMIQWPVGLGIQENAGVADLVKKIPGSIGYVSLNYAIKNNLSTAALQNAAGNFVKPTVAAVSAAASIDLPRDTRVLLTNSRISRAYPICGFTYILVLREQFYRDRSPEQARALVKFLLWCIHEGQQHAEPLFYAPLPEDVALHVEGVIRSITYKGKPLL